jgi:bacterioferritin
MVYRDGQQSQSALADVGTLVEHLNDDLAGELQAIAMYIQYSAMLTGPHRKDLRDLFQAEIPDELRHAQFLADKIAVFGGTPTTVPRPVPQASTPYQMLQNVLEAERRAIADYTQRVAEAEEHDEIGLKVELENQIADETRHRDEVEQILAGATQDNLGGFNG